MKFSPTKKVKSSTAKVSSVSSSADKEKYLIVKKDVRGVVWITIDGSYKVVVGDDVYDIFHRNYNCGKKKSLYYEQLIENRLVRYIRHLPNKDNVISGYLPFGVGCSVIGTIVSRQRDRHIFFNIRKVFIDRDSQEAINAINYYRENMDKINSSR